MMISRYEVGLNSIPYKRIEKIAKILGKPVSYFFDGKVEKENTTN